MKLKPVKPKTLSGGKLAGGNPKNDRVKNDFYATDPLALEMLLKEYKFNNDTFLEPCVGNGNLIKVIKKEYPSSIITSIDLIDRGVPETIIADFLTYDTSMKFDNIITNPPFSLATEFVYKSIDLLNENGKIAMFLKIQFLESVKRKELFKKFPPKYIYVFSKRMATWNNGKEFDDNNKKWSTTMCHAWFIWEKNSISEPIIRWL